MDERDDAESCRSHGTCMKIVNAFCPECKGWIPVSEMQKHIAEKHPRQKTL